MMIITVKTKKEKNRDLDRAQNHAQNGLKSLNRVSAKRGKKAKFPYVFFFLFSTLRTFFLNFLSVARGQNQSASDRAPRQKTRKKLAKILNLVIKIKKIKIVLK